MQLRRARIVWGSASTSGSKHGSRISRMSVFLLIVAFARHPRRVRVVLQRHRVVRAQAAPGRRRRRQRAGRRGYGAARDHHPAHRHPRSAAPRPGDEIGIGAILGAPFMLSTLAMFVCGISVVIFTLTKRRTHQDPLQPGDHAPRPGLLPGAPTRSPWPVGIFDIGPFRYVVAALLIVGYALYVQQDHEERGRPRGRVPGALLPPHGRIPAAQAGDPADHRGAGRHHLRRRPLRATN